MEQDQWLVHECLKNNRAAQKQLYNQYAEAMLGVCYRYTKSMADAQDVLQEGFIRVFKNLHQFKNEGQLGGWVRRIMVTTALNYLKRNAKYQQELVFDKLDQHVVSDETPEMNLTVKELASLVQQLPTGYQTIFNLHAVEGYNHVEIGEMLGISDGTSRSQYARARALLVLWIKTNYSSNILHYAK
jgi:RNA polymerase sigma-70 factor (ECF subfamily)